MIVFVVVRHSIFDPCGNGGNGLGGMGSALKNLGGMGWEWGEWIPKKIRRPSGGDFKFFSSYPCAQGMGGMDWGEWEWSLNN